MAYTAVMANINDPSQHSPEHSMSLCDEFCYPCTGDAPAIDDEEAKALLKQLPQWAMIHCEGVRQLQRNYKLESFTQALELAQRIGELAETHNHHPALLVEWGKLIVTWWTHAIKGLHRNDFVMAAKTDQIFQKTVTLAR